MGLQDITGVLSRYFVVGYWVPCVFTLFALGLSVSDELLPATYRALGWEAKALVLGAIALLIGLALLGLRYPLTRILEGYWPEQWPLRPLKAALTRLQARSYDKLVRIRDENTKKAGTAKTKEEAAKARALATTQVRLLDRKFHSQRGKLLPTRFGNAYRAFENYPYTRYGLDMIAIWPRIDALLSEQERELHTKRCLRPCVLHEQRAWRGHRRRCSCRRLGPAVVVVPDPVRPRLRALPCVRRCC